MRVLVVDDSLTMRALLRVTLAARGLDVAEAEDGECAIAWLDAHEADLVITDINMPRLDGFGLIARVRATARHRDCPILVLTTESSAEKRARARAAGATGWLVKPFDPDTLAAAIRRVAL
jgi:two-component system, chemotaxis family, chemotaxis protein CheY